MSIKQILNEINTLPLEQQMEVYAYLSAKLKQKEDILLSLEKIKGKGKGIWNVDAQDYINNLRKDDRF